LAGFPVRSPTALPLGSVGTDVWAWLPDDSPDSCRGSHRHGRCGLRAAGRRRRAIGPVRGHRRRAQLRLRRQPLRAAVGQFGAVRVGPKSRSAAIERPQRGQAQR